MRFHGRYWGLAVGPQASGGGMGSPHAMVAWATTMASHAACDQQPWVIANCLCTESAARALPRAEPKIYILSSQLPANTCQPPARQELNTAFEPMI
jgi:hypothetical protein